MQQNSFNLSFNNQLHFAVTKEQRFKYKKNEDNGPGSYYIPSDFDRFKVPQNQTRNNYNGNKRPPPIPSKNMNTTIKVTYRQTSASKRY